MAVIAEGMTKNVLGNTDLSLEADTGEAFLIKDIMIASPASNFATMKVKNTTVGYYRVAGEYGNQLQYPMTDEENASLIGLLIDKGLMDPIPVPEGEKFIIQNVAQASAVQTVVYDVVEPGDISADMPNHPAANNYQIVNYGRPSGVPAAGDTLYDSQQSPAEFPGFPFANDVPTGKEIVIKGILFGDIAKDTSAGTNQQKTQYLKLVKERTVLFDEDRNGLLYVGGSYTGGTETLAEGQSVGGYYSANDNRLPLILSTPLVFASGQELNLYVTTVVDAGSVNLVASDVEIGLITEIREAG